MSSTVINPARRIRGEIVPPGDKSLSHRAAMIAALADGTSQVTNFSPCEDCQRTLQCLRALGIAVGQWQTEKGSLVEIAGRGLYGFRPPEGVLDAGNSGSTIRMLSGILAGQPFAATITGDASLRRRPMDRIVHPLRLMGATITACEDRFAPLTIRGGELRPISYHLPIPSAQVKSAILLAGLYAPGVTIVSEPVASRNHTEIMLKEFGADVTTDEGKTSVVGRSGLIPQSYEISGDPSAAAFFIAAAAALRGSELVVRRMLVNPTRTGFFDALKELGVTLDLVRESIVHGERVADVIVRSERESLRQRSEPYLVAGRRIPILIDEIPILAVLATQTRHGVIIRDAHELRAKESDRIRTIVTNLRRMGAHVSEQDDGMIIPGDQKLRGAEIDPAGDHRIAMAFAIAGLLAEGETVIRDSECVAVSFPGFFSVLDHVVER
ncbi:MAG TPA: 3-phosphoshikimate 1-carboxyvinyltransferase [Blastocatellia bacterium]|nr:3-phosphoshikimate 1-carboxyvinyltransferase [Blastocatellia bacterium]